MKPNLNFFLIIGVVILMFLVFMNISQTLDVLSGTVNGIASLVAVTGVKNTDSYTESRLGTGYAIQLVDKCPTFSVHESENPLLGEVDGTTNKSDGAKAAKLQCEGKVTSANTSIRQKLDLEKAQCLGSIVNVSPDPNNNPIYVRCNSTEFFQPAGPCSAPICNPINNANNNWYCSSSAPGATGHVKCMLPPSALPSNP
jgi:hypothetical protein